MERIIVYILFAGLIPFLSYAKENKGGLFVEPMLTYEVGDSKIDYPAPFGSSDGETQGFGVGARLGFHIYEAVFLGVDARYARFDIDNKNPNYETDATGYNYGPVIGFQVPTTFGVRVWAGYIMGGEMDLDQKNNVDLKLTDARGYRVGAGVKLAIVSLNLEYQRMSYNEAQLTDNSIFTGSRSNLNADVNSYIFSVSFPFSI
jgi:hypothetical protein